MKKQFYNQFKNSYLQTFDDKKENRKGFTICEPIRWISANQSRLVKLNESGGGVFFTPNPCKGGRKETNVTSIEWVYADLDEGTKDQMLERIDASPIVPNFIVETARGYHLYWKCKCERKEFDRIIKGVIKFFDSDPAISSTNEVLRLPGFNHMKGEPFMVNVEYSDMNNIQTPEEMIKAFPYIPIMLEFKEKHNLTETNFDLIKQAPIKELLNKFGVKFREIIS